MWGRFDDNFPHHPKARRAGPEACWLFVCGVLHCNRFATDGFVDALDLEVLYPHGDWTPAHRKYLAKRLTDAGMWEVVPGGWRIHDYAEYQREAMKDAREERRKWEADRKARQRAAKRAGVAPSEKQPPRDDCPGGTGVGQHHGTRVGHDGGTPVGHGGGTGAGHDSGTSQESAPGTPAAPSSEPALEESSALLQGGSASMSQAPVPSRPVPSRPVPEKNPNPLVELVGGSAADAAQGEAPTPKVAAEVRRVFEHWQRALEHPKARLDPKRTALIRRQLRAYSADDLCRAIDGYARDPFTRGENDRNKPFDDIELLLRDAQHVERGLRFLEAPRPAAAAQGDPWEEALAKENARLAEKRAALAQEAARG